MVFPIRGNSAGPKPRALNEKPSLRGYISDGLALLFDHQKIRTWMSLKALICCHLSSAFWRVWSAAGGCASYAIERSHAHVGYGPIPIRG
jgi:hypothetical protein